MTTTHRDLALHYAENAADVGSSLCGVIHALLAVEDRLDVLAHAVGNVDPQRGDLDKSELS